MSTLLDHPICFQEPRRLSLSSPWHHHVPFGFFLVDVLKPAVVVELGTQYGDSYCAFCQAVKELHLPTHCYAIGTWQGDPPTGPKGSEVLADLRAHHDPLYGGFSNLVQSTFEDASHRFADKSIDLLHIDGYHGYEQVKRDFEIWLPKVQPECVILLHNTNVRGVDSGVRKLWEELKPRYPHFEFFHGQGLGVLALGDVHNEKLRALFDATEHEAQSIRSFFSQLGHRLTLRVEIESKEREVSNLQARLAERDQQVAALQTALNGQAEQSQRLEQERAWLSARIREADRRLELIENERALLIARLESMNDSLAWKLVQRYRRVKSRFLPPATRRRDMYDWLLNWLKSAGPSSGPLIKRGPSRQGQRKYIVETPDDFYRAKLAAISVPTVLEAGETGTATVAVTNDSRHVWRAATNERNERGSVRICTRWHDEAERIAVWDGLSTPLPRDLGPGESVAVNLPVVAPLQPASYTLGITLLHKGVVWFDRKGNTVERVPVRVETRREEARTPIICSVIIPVFNRAAFTRACLQSIEKSISAEELPYEVIVVDNDSTDEVPELLRAWAESHSGARVVTMKRNSGFARACNEGARWARGKYLVFLNNDTVPFPGWLEAMVQLAENEPQVGVVGSKLLYPDGRIQHIGIAFDEDKNPRHIYRGSPANIPPACISREYQAVTGACLLVPKELFDTVNGFDEVYRNFFEDTDLCLKVRARGYRVMMCADSVLYHFEGITEGRGALDLHNYLTFQARWRNKIEPDAERRYALDGMQRDGTAELTEREGYDLRKERQLEEVFQQLYGD